jgi:hypothetical protein
MLYSVRRTMLKSQASFPTHQYYVSVREAEDPLAQAAEFADWPIKAHRQARSQVLAS